MLNERDQSQRYLTSLVIGLSGLLILTWLVLQSGLLGAIFPEDKSRLGEASMEEAWDAQVAAVKQGAADRIEVSREVIGDEQLVQLAGLSELREVLVWDPLESTCRHASLSIL